MEIITIMKYEVVPKRQTDSGTLVEAYLLVDGEGHYYGTIMIGNVTLDTLTPSRPSMLDAAIVLLAELYKRHPKARFVCYTNS